MSKLILLALFITTIFCLEGVEVEDNVMVMNTGNFDSVIDHYEFVMVKFYAPWCGHCKKMKPEYIAAADVYSEGEPFVAFGDVEATIEENHPLTVRFGIRGYPTIKFFINGDEMDFTGERTEDGIIDWIESKIVTSIVELHDLESLELEREEHRVLILLYGHADTEEFHQVDITSKNYDDLPWFISHDPEIGEALGLEENSVVMLKQFDEGRNDF